MAESLEGIRSILGKGELLNAIQMIHRDGDPVTIADRYDALVRELYWKDHNLPAVTDIGRTGICFCIGRAAEAGTGTDEQKQIATKLRSNAKQMAYNVGSFSWPGWEEPGITPSSEDLAFGRQCAQLNYRLTIELQRPAVGVSKAHWLIGAHALVQHNFQQAAREFEQAQEVLKADENATRNSGPLNLGYLAIARLGMNPANTDAISTFTEITEGLAKRNDADAKTYLSQLLAAKRLYGPVNK